jgi:Predicted nucleotide-binding protein containing TIR-like domain
MANPLHIIGGAAATLQGQPDLAPANRAVLLAEIYRQTKILALICLEPKIMHPSENGLEPRPTGVQSHPLTGLSPQASSGTLARSTVPIPKPRAQVRFLSGASRVFASSSLDVVSRRKREWRMNKPRIFLGSSAKQAELLEAIAQGLEDVADVEPWMTTFNPGRSTLDRLVELSQEVDFAAFVFAQDDWTTTDTYQSGQASPRDNVVFEAGLFGGALGIRRTFILHAKDSKLPTDLLGMTSVRYDPAAGPDEVGEISDKLRKVIESEGRRASVEGLWWQLSLTMRTDDEPSAVSLLQISRERDGGLNVAGRAWQEDGTLSARYWSEAAKERSDPAGIFYFWRGERPRHPNAPQLEGTGEIRVETADRAAGYWTTRSDRDPGLNARTAGVYLRADPSDMQVLDRGSEAERAELIAQRLREWKSAANAL